MSLYCALIWFVSMPAALQLPARLKLQSIASKEFLKSVDSALCSMLFFRLKLTSWKTQRMNTTSSFGSVHSLCFPEVSFNLKNNFEHKVESKQYFAAQFRVVLVAWRAAGIETRPIKEHNIMAYNHMLKFVRCGKLYLLSGYYVQHT